ncbi:uncharacterized protein TNCV_3378171 [Trichonephila clavipes]|nr:uncharacterized protein TNCV_3378171 [Trichonephila clavipes]
MCGSGLHFYGRQRAAQRTHIVDEFHEEADIRLNPRGLRMTILLNMFGDSFILLDDGARLQKALLMGNNLRDEAIVPMGWPAHSRQAESKMFGILQSKVSENRVQRFRYVQKAVRLVGCSETSVMPAVAIETVIIIIVVVSFTVLAAVIFALYWLWRLLLEDRRCSRLGSRAFQHEWQRQSLGPLEDASQRALLGSRGRNPRISRREMFVDERSRRMVKANRCVQCPQQPQPPPVVPRREEAAPPPASPEVVVLDGTEPPPPYEETVSQARPSRRSHSLSKSPIPLEGLHKDLVLKATDSQECVLEMPGRKVGKTFIVL